MSTFAEDSYISSFIEHFAELRTRIIRTLVGVFVAIGGCWFFHEPLLKILLAPVKRVLPPNGQIVASTVQEAFITNFFVAVVAALVISSPHTFYQFWRFVAPGLTAQERKLTLPFVFWTTLLFVLGTTFAYTVFFPYSFQFFLGFASEDVTPMLKIMDYVSFSLKMLTVFGFLFELPVLSFFFTKLGLLTPEALRSQRRFAIVMAFVVGAIFTPPEPGTQILLAVPIMILYEISIFSSAFALPGKKRSGDSPTGESSAAQARMVSREEFTARSTPSVATQATSKAVQQLSEETSAPDLSFEDNVFVPFDELSSEQLEWLQKLMSLPPDTWRMIEDYTDMYDRPYEFLEKHFPAHYQELIAFVSETSPPSPPPKDE